MKSKLIKSLLAFLLSFSMAFGATMQVHAASEVRCKYCNSLGELYVIGYRYINASSTHHQRVARGFYTCSGCYETIGWRDLGTPPESEPHHFSGNRCTDCGYRGH